MNQEPPRYLLSRRRGCGRRAGDPSGGERHGEQAPPAPRRHLSGGGEGSTRSLGVEIGERSRGAPLSALAGVGEPEAWSVHARGGADLVAADGGGPASSTAMAGPGLGRAGPSQSIWLGQLEYWTQLGHWGFPALHVVAVDTASNSKCLCLLDYY